MTYEEFVEYAERFARDHNEPGTLSLRHLQRLASGQWDKGRPNPQLRPATARLLQAIFEVPVDVLIAPPSVPADLASNLDIASRVGAPELEELKADLQALRRSDLKFGSSATYSATRQFELRVRALRVHSINPHMRAKLADLHSQICTLAGWQCLDLGRTTYAWHYYTEARAAAAESGSSGLLAYAKVEQSYVLLDMASPTKAMELLASVDGEQCPPEVGVYVHAARGEMLALERRQDASRAAFDYARFLLSKCDNGWPYPLLSSPDLERWQANAEALLDAEDGERIKSILTATNRTSIRATCELKIALANSYVRKGNLDEAATLANDCLDQAAKIGSAKLGRRATRLLSGLRAKKNLGT